jgi:heme-degrading monooxygenase HmoA
MHARISKYSGEAESLLDGFQGATKPLEQIAGFTQAYFLVDRANNKAISITIWEDEDALNASSAKADELRKGATAPSGATIESVETYEIAITAAPAKAGIS